MSNISEYCNLVKPEVDKFILALSPNVGMGSHGIRPFRLVASIANAHCIFGGTDAYGTLRYVRKYPANTIQKESERLTRSE